MSSPIAGDLKGCRRIIVADEDPKVVQFVIRTLRHEGHSVFHAYDGMSAVELVFALDYCHLVISNTKVDGLPGIELIRMLRARLPNLPILYVANVVRSTPAIEAELPENVPIIREPFTADELRLSVARMFAGETERSDVAL